MGFKIDSRRPAASILKFSLFAEPITKGMENRPIASTRTAICHNAPESNAPCVGMVQAGLECPQLERFRPALAPDGNRTEEEPDLAAERTDRSMRAREEKRFTKWPSAGGAGHAEHLRSEGCRAGPRSLWFVAPKGGGHQL